MPSSIKPCPRGSNVIYEFYSLVLEVFWTSLQDASIHLSSFSFAFCCECGCFIRLHTAPGDIDSPFHAILWLGRWSRFGNAQCMFPRASSSGEHWCKLTFLTYLIFLLRQFHRHGSRYPGAGDIPSIASLSSKLNDPTTAQQIDTLNLPAKWKFIQGQNRWSNTLITDNLTASGRKQNFDDGVK